MTFPCTRFAILAIVLCATDLRASDIVFVRNSKPGQPPVQRQGQITNIVGNELLIHIGPTIETLSLDDVIEWRTTWSAAKLQADALYREKKYAEAAEAYVRARYEEQRGWALRHLNARLVECYSATSNLLKAGQEFPQVVLADMNTREWEIAPLAWRPVDDAGALAEAREWIRHKNNPVTTLLGASWLLAGPQRTEAIDLLNRLTQHGDKPIATMATMQLWRTRIASSSPDEPATWLAALERVAIEGRPFGYYFVGEAFARHNQPEKAVLAYMRVPILYPRTQALAADALLVSGFQLEKLDRREQAAALYREVLTDHAELLPAAATARLRLDQLSTPAPKP